MSEVPVIVKQYDAGEIAEALADALSDMGVLPSWEVRGLDIGEVEIDLPNGQKFRLVVEERFDD